MNCSHYDDYCPNPGCLHKVKSSWKPFKNKAGLSIHLSKSPICKAYFLKLPATSTFTLHHSSQPVLTSNPTANILKKRHLMINPSCSLLASLVHLKNIVSTNYKEMDNNIISLPPNDDDSLLFHEEELFSIDDIIVDNDGFEHFHKCVLAPKPKKVPPNETGPTSSPHLKSVLHH